jgi:hypothetical protein
MLVVLFICLGLFGFFLLNDDSSSSFITLLGTSLVCISIVGLIVGGMTA